MQQKSQFLYDFSKYILHKYNGDFSQLLLILPTYSASQSLYRELSKFTKKSIWMPKVLSLVDMIKALSPLRSASNYELITLLHSAYNKNFNSESSCEANYFLYKRLLYDFNLIDSTGIHIDEVDEDKYLTNGIVGHGEFIECYKAYTKILLERELGYEGLCYREAHRSILQRDPKILHKYLSVAGFAAFSPVEESIFKALSNYTSLDFYWDLSEDYINTEEKKAGTFLRKYKHDDLFNKEFYAFQRQVSCTKIDIIETQSRVAQVHVVASRIAELINSVDEESALSEITIAIILQNTDLLIPLMHALPVSAAEVSVNVSYPVQHTSVYALILRLINLYVSQLSAPLGTIKLDVVESILATSVLSIQVEVNELLKNIAQSHKSYISIADLCRDNRMLNGIFNTHAIDNLINYLMNVIANIRPLLKDLNTVDLELLALNSIEEKFIELTQLVDIVQDMNTFSEVIKDDIKHIKLPINRQTNSCINILSIQSTACIDYDYIFILDATEGNYPSTAKHTGLIATSKLKNLVNFFDYKETADAYLFYRLLHRSKEIVGLYDSNQNEMSRYLLQFYYDFPSITTKYTQSSSISLCKPVSIVIQKNDSVMAKLQKFNLKNFPNATMLTPSSITTYVDCTLKFYFRYIEEIKPAKKREPLAKDAMFGTVVHKAMEAVYKPFISNKSIIPITKQEINGIIDNLEDTLELFFKNIFESGLSDKLLPREGYNILAKEITLKCVKKILAADIDYTPFSIIGLEEGLEDALCVNHEVSPRCIIRLGGVIDRIDLKNAVFRVIDYKTGAISPKISSIDSLFDSESKNHNNPVLQILLYGWILNKSGRMYNQQITPCLASTRQVFGGNPDFNIYLKDGQSFRAILSIDGYMDDITIGLDKVIGELFDEKIHFVQTENKNICAMCDYAKICQKF
jgi:hypothetical protein